MNSKMEALISKTTEQANEIAEAWLKERSNDLEIKVRGMLDERLVALVASVMGLRYSFGRWEVDHCNGRSGESAAGDWLKERTKDAAKKWFDEQAGNLPSLTKLQINALHRAYQEALERELLEQLEAKAKADAIQAVGRFID